LGLRPRKGRTAASAARQVSSTCAKKTTAKCFAGGSGAPKLISHGSYSLEDFQSTVNTNAHSETKELKTAAYQDQQEVVIAAKPEVVYDAATGDITGSWDHHMSEHPKKMYIDAKPGGCFCEIFDDSGDGAQHAVVIYAVRGKMLRYTEPLGFSGTAIDAVTAYEFLPDPAGTKLRVTVNMVGQIDEQTAHLVDGVWHHFIAERLKPYVESKNTK